MIRLKEAVVVEGKYDTIRLHSVLDALILETNGFGIFKDKEKLALLRRLAQQRGLLILTDSDSAGFVIRDFLSGAIPPEQLHHAYIPEIAGKEKRKAHTSKEGLLGVEGMDEAQLEQAIRRAGVTPLGESAREETPFLTRIRLYEDGLSGRPDSAAKRQRFAAAAGLPASLSTARLMRVVNTVMTEEQYRDLLTLIG